MSRRPFLERWSRLKKAAATPATVDAETLLANLGPDSDFGVFLRAEVGDEVRRQALKQLFADPHFNVMDGLDVYIDDYSISEAIPEAMLATLRQAQAQTLFAAEREGARGPAETGDLAGPEPTMRAAPTALANTGDRELASRPPSLDAQDAANAVLRARGAA